MLTQHPEDALPDPGVTFLNCDVARQCLERGLLDEFYVHLAPVMLGDGVRLFDAPGIEPVRWERIRDDGAAQVTEVVELRYRPAR